MSDHPDTGLVTSYMTLRKFIGILGLALPLALLAGDVRSRRADRNRNLGELTGGSGRIAPTLL